MPRSKIDIREKNSGNTTSLSFRAGGREKISSEKSIGSKRFCEASIRLISCEARYQCHKYMGKIAGVMDWECRQSRYTRPTFSFRIADVRKVGPNSKHLTEKEVNTKT